MVKRLRPSPRVPPMHELSDAQARRLGGLLCCHGHRPATEVWSCPLCRRWVITGSTHWLAAMPPQVSIAAPPGGGRRQPGETWDEWIVRVTQP